MNQTVTVTGDYVIVAPDGTQITVQPTIKSVVLPPPPMMFGVTMLSTEYATVVPVDFPNNPVGRDYTPAGAGLHGWASVPMQAARKACDRCVWGSMKDTPSAALLNPVFDAIPAGYVYRLTIHHEPEQGPGAGDPDLATYQRDWATVRAVADDHPKRDQIVLTEVLTDYAETHGKGPWDKWWTGHADEIGFDIYMADVTSTAYPSAEALFAFPLSVAKTIGCRVAFAEYAGNPLVVQPPKPADGGAAYADVIEAHHGFVADSGLCSAMIYFNEKGTSGDHRLDNVPVAKKRVQALVGR